MSEVDVSAFERLRAARRTLEQQLKVAHWVGEMTATMARRRLADEFERLRAARTHVEPVPAVHDPEAQPFNDYDSITAAELMPLLGQLPKGELLMVREYEANHRNRRTVLAKVERLLADH